MFKVLVAVGGSVHAQHAIDAVVRLQAQTKGLQALLVNVRQWPVLYGDLPPDGHTRARCGRQPADRIGGSACRAPRQGAGRAGQVKHRAR